MFDGGAGQSCQIRPQGRYKKCSYSLQRTRVILNQKPSFSRVFIYFPTCDIIPNLSNLTLREDWQGMRRTLSVSSLHATASEEVKTSKTQVLCRGLGHPLICPCRTRAVTHHRSRTARGRYLSRLGPQRRSQGGLLDHVSGTAWLVDKAILGHPLLVCAVLQHAIPHLLRKQVGDHGDILATASPAKPLLAG